MKTVEMSTRILTWMAHQREDCGVSDMSREFGIDKATVSRHMQALMSAGFVERSPSSRRYRPGFALVELSGLLLDKLRLLDLARPLMSGLWQKTGESLQLSILRGSRGAFYIHRLESPDGVKLMSRIGSYGPLHATAAGRAMFAFLPVDSIERVLAGKLEKNSPCTVTDPEEIRKELQIVREQGYAVDERRFNEHLTSIAAPIFASSETPVAAIAIGGPSDRFSRKRIRELSGALLVASQQLSRDLENQHVPEAVLP